MGKLAKQGQPGVQYAKVDLRKNPQMGQEYGVRSIPDTRFFHNGKEIGKFVGSCNEALLRKMVTGYLSSVRPPEEVVPSPRQGKQGAVAGSARAVTPTVAPAPPAPEPAIRPAVKSDGLPPGIQRIPAP